MPDVYIKTPNLDSIFEKWKNQEVRRNKKKMEKEFGTKGAVFSLNQISAAEFVKNTNKEAAIYFAIKKSTAPAKGSEIKTIPASRINREVFYSFKGQKVNKENWKDKEKVPIFESIKQIPCDSCKGKGFTQQKCKSCKGSGKVQLKGTVLVGENKEKKTHVFEIPCAECYGTGNIQARCRECGGHKYNFQYEIRPVPFITVVTGIPVLHASTRKYEKEIGEDLHKLIKEVEGIKFKDFKTLEAKAEASLGYFNKNIKKAISLAKSDYTQFQKDKNAEIITQIHLFPLIQLICTTKRGSNFEIYSIGSQNGFIIYSTF
ncbi:MAG: zinc finger-like domain-containing protein [Promethearchaeia archaeon]